MCLYRRFRFARPQYFRELFCPGVATLYAHHCPLQHVIIDEVLLFAVFVQTWYDNYLSPHESMFYWYLQEPRSVAPVDDAGGPGELRVSSVGHANRCVRGVHPLLYRQAHARDVTKTIGGTGLGGGCSPDRTCRVDLAGLALGLLWSAVVVALRAMVSGARFEASNRPIDS